MAIPYRARTARNCLYVLQNPVPSSSAMKRTLLMMKGHFRPQRSAAIPVRTLISICSPARRCTRVISRRLKNQEIGSIPNTTLPTDLNISTKVMPQVIWEFSLSNCFASCSTVNETVKKSNASQVQPAKPTRKNIHCWNLSIASSLSGFGALFIGGLRVGMRVAK